MSLCPSIQMRLHEAVGGADGNQTEDKTSTDKITSASRSESDDSAKTKTNTPKEDSATNAIARRRKSGQPMKLSGAKKIVLISLTSTILLFKVSLQFAVASHQATGALPIKHVNTLTNYHQYLSRLLLHLEREQRQHLQSISRNNIPVHHQEQTHGSNVVVPEQRSGWQPYWTHEDQQPTRQPQQYQQQPNQQAPAASGLADRKPAQDLSINLNSQIATTPTLNRQIGAPFYELGLASTRAIQIEPITPQQADPEQPASGNELSVTNHQTVIQSPVLSVVSPHSRAQPGGQREGRVADMTAEAQSSGPIESIKLIAKSSDQTTGSADAANPDNKPTSKLSNESESRNSQLSTDSIEPRQRRRMWNRILKKTEWNYLFVEMSKVFLRYFLDLALKDIIGKQGGSSSLGSSSGSSSSNGDGTTSRKKLDAQSELTDVLKEFVKTAISNL